MNEIYIDNFRGLDNLIMIAPNSYNCNFWLNDEQKWELSKSGKMLYIVQYDNNKEIGRKGFRMNCISGFGYSKGAEE